LECIFSAMSFSQRVLFEACLLRSALFIIEPVSYYHCMEYKYGYL
jgi:hypothetical protein